MTAKKSRREPISWENVTRSIEIHKFMKWQDEGIDIDLPNQPFWLRECIDYLRLHPEEKLAQDRDIRLWRSLSYEDYQEYVRKSMGIRRRDWIRKKKREEEVALQEQKRCVCCGRL